MAWMPEAIHKNIRPGSNDPAIDPIGIILHVAVSEGKTLFDFFKYRSGGIESHFYIRRDGTIEQYRSTGYEADANYKANSFYSGGRRKGFISVETQGMGAGDWTPEQMRSIKALILWASAEHGIPLRVAPGPYSPGVGYHVLYPNHWTPVSKSCPGPDRVKQFNSEIVPWFDHGDKEDFNMDKQDAEKMMRDVIRDEFADARVADPRKGAKKVFSLARLLWNQKRILSRIETSLEGVIERLDNIENDRK